ncbi:ER membrane protein complex subunit 8/9, partial [Tremellales sp. Uapishka_1]
MSTPTYLFTPQSYILPLLHAAAHPSNLNGVFLSQASASSSSPIELATAVPLLHQYTSLSPMMEIGLDMVSIYAAERGLQISGYYQANERGNELGRIGERIRDKLGKEVFALVIDNEKIGSGEIPYIVYPPSSSTPLESAEGHFSLPPAHSSLPTEALKLIREDNLHEGFGDFDDHLENVRIDWLNNPATKEKIQMRFP